MTILLSKNISGVKTTLDVSRLLDEETNVIISNERERFDLQRIVDDLRMNASNFNSELADFFSDVKGSDIISVSTNDDGRITFRGEVFMKSLSFDVRDEWCSMSAYHVYKTFWERARQTRIQLVFSPQEKSLVFETLGNVLRKNLIDRSSSNPAFSDLFQTVDVDSDLTLSELRYYADSSNPLIGNDGKYAHLDTSLTVAELLEALMLYFNAEMYIDNDSGHMVFSKRYPIINDKQWELSDILRDDSKIEMQQFGAKSFKYIYAPTKVLNPAAPIFLSFIDGQIPNSPNPTINSYTYEYRYTCWIDDVETLPSQPLYVDIPYKKWVKMKLPAVLPMVQRRSLYRSIVEMSAISTVPPIFHPEMYFLRDVDGYVETTLTDAFLGDKNSQFFSTSFKGLFEAAWIGYDEAKGEWLDPIYDVLNGSNTPIGDVYSIIPSLRFLDNSGQSKPFSFNEMFKFFGGKDLANDVRTRWHDFVVSKPLLIVPAKGTGYMVGDSCKLSKKIFPNLKSSSKMVIKKALINAYKEESDLEVLAI